MATAQDQREYFRITADFDEQNAGVLVDRNIVSAKLVDYSTAGCKIELTGGAEINIGDEVRVATVVGQHFGIVRRIRKCTDGNLELGVEYTAPVGDDYKTGNAVFLTANSGKHVVGGKFPTALVAFVAVWAIIGLVVYLYCFQK